MVATTTSRASSSSYPDRNGQAGSPADDVQYDDLLGDDDYIDQGSDTRDDTSSLKDAFTKMMMDIRHGVVLSEGEGGRLGVLAKGGGLRNDDLAVSYADTIVSLDRSCTWLPPMLAELISPKGKTAMKKYGPLLDRLLNHPECKDFFTWKNDAQKESLLHEATRNGQKGLIMHIFRRRHEQVKAGLTQKSGNGLTCLHIAAQRDSPDPTLMELLLRIVGNAKAMLRGAEGNTPLHLAVDVQRCRPHQELVVSTLLEAAKDAIMAKNSQGLTPLQYHHKTGSHLGFNPAAKNPTSQKIENMLRLSCLRLDIDRDQTWEILYGVPTERREFTFDLYGYEEIRADDLENLSEHICLDTILKSVTIPDLIVHPPGDFQLHGQDKTALGNSNRVGREVARAGADRTPEGGSDEELGIPPDCPGRIDYCWVFKWLRDRGVERILNVAVKDQKNKPHSDEAIEWCLKHSRVEVLDWNRLDIDSATIMKAAARVRDLTLHCSGNYAVLRSWLSPGGLAELEDLEVLNLKIVLGLESLTRTTRQAEHFNVTFLEKRKQWCQEQEHKNAHYTGHEDAPCARHKVKVNWIIVRSDGSSVKAKAESEDDRRAEVEKQEWIQCMEKFASFIRGYREDIEEEEDDPKKHPPRVKVALIDDGVDGLNADLSRSIAAGQSFSERGNYKNDSHAKHHNPYFRSTRGHGTIMAMLLRKICPNVRLYVAKLNEKKTGSNSYSITAESAIKAIRWAIEHKVHIISMSWTINPPTGDGTINSLVAAINEAVANGILVFCSVSDQGPRDGGTYPANCNRSNSFLIGTATVSGQAWCWNGTNNVDYILPGTDLEVGIGDALFDSRQKSLYESGSSLATALASGLAALVLDCVALNDAAEMERMRDRAHAKMTMALDSIDTTGHKSTDVDKYLRVWHTFGRALKEDKGDDRRKLKFVVDTLLSKVRQEAGPWPRERSVPLQDT